MSIQSHQTEQIDLIRRVFSVARQYNHSQKNDTLCLPLCDSEPPFCSDLACIWWRRLDSSYRSGAGRRRICRRNEGMFHFRAIRDDLKQNGNFRGQCHSRLFLQTYRKYLMTRPMDLE